MKIVLPNKTFLKKTGDVDYYNWNYQFPINIIQNYRFKKIVNLLGKKKYPKLLEIGTGSGIFLPELSKHCTTLYASDIHNNYEHIPKLCDYYHIKDYKINQENIENMDYPDNSFDAIVAVSVLEFVKDIQRALDEIKRILKPCGVFITICPMQNSFLDSILSIYTNKKPHEEFGNSRIWVTKKLEENFRVVKTGYMLPVIGKWFPVYTHYKLAK